MDLVFALISGGVLSTLISGVISCVSVGINRKFNAEHETNMIELKDKLEQKSEDDRRKFEENRDKLKRDFEQDLIKIKTNFEKEIYTYKARYDHKVKMMMEMFDIVTIVDTAALDVLAALSKKSLYFLKKYKEFNAKCIKHKVFLCKYHPFVKKEVIENFGRFCREVFAFINGVFVFWYEREFLIEKDKNPQDKNDNIDFEDLRIIYEGCVGICYDLTEFRNVYEILDLYTEFKNKLMDGLSEQVREYLNEK